MMWCVMKGIGNEFWVPVNHLEPLVIARSSILLISPIGECSRPERRSSAPQVLGIDVSEKVEGRDGSQSRRTTQTYTYPTVQDC